MYNLYTDGSCESNSRQGAVCGWAVAVYKDNIQGLEIYLGSKSGYIEKSHSGYAELFALKEAVDWAVRSKEKATIHVDCLSLKKVYDDLSAYGERWFRNPKGRPLRYADLWRVVLRTRNQAVQPITVEYVKAHSGVGGNDKADLLAEIATTEGQFAFGEVFKETK